MNFSHWNMAVDFSLFEVACLSLGIEPDENVQDPKVKSIMRLMEDAYERARESCESILEQNEIDRANGKEESFPRYDVDSFEEPHGLPSRDLRWSFAEALQDPENRRLVSADEDQMRFLRYDLGCFFEECHFKPHVAIDDIIKSPTPELPQLVRNDLKEVPQPVRGDQNKDAVDRLITTRERTTLLTIIGVIMKEANLDYKKSAKTAALILGMAARMGVNIGETTIEGHLKKIPDALARRMK